jgi:MFS superfamily sulfate permease-like transporter
MIGAVGVTLFLLGLEITLPFSSPHLSFSSLFNKAHLPLLAASLGPAALLSLSTRLSCLDRLPSKPTKHPLYIPLFCCAVAGVFWLVVVACEDTSIQGLASAGWLFMSEQGPTQATSAAEWDYWTLFNFSKVEWRALSAGIRDILLLVLIGALSLPIFASAAAQEWGEPDHSMNHEFVGHGISNTVAGAMGALPNLLVGIPAPITKGPSLMQYRCTQTPVSSTRREAAAPKQRLSRFSRLPSSLSLFVSYRMCQLYRPRLLCCILALS